MDPSLPTLHQAKVVVAALFTIAFIAYACITYPAVNSLPHSSKSSLLGSRVWIEQEHRYGTITGFAVVNGETFPMIKSDDNDLKFITESPKKDDM